MIRGMAGLNGDEGAAAGGGHFVVRDQFAFDNRAVVSRFNYARHQVDWFIRWRRSQEFDRVVSGNRTRRVIKTVALHQVISGSPVAVAVEHGAGNASAQHAGKCFLVRLRLPVSDNFFAGWEAANVQSLFVCRATAETLEIWGVSFLDAFVSHCLGIRFCDG
jgi:hypothetical protein